MLTDTVSDEHKLEPYRFDAEHDIPWQDLEQDGAHIGGEFLAKVGIDVQALRAHGRALEILEWSLALASCRAFEMLEKLIIDFTTENTGTMSQGCIERLNEEELKHMAVFRRYGEHLVSLRPEWAERFVALHDESLELYRTNAKQQAFPNKNSMHFAFWLNTLFFEEYAIYFAELLSESSDEIQPVWLRLNALHRREEIQHVIDDASHLRNTKLSEDERARRVKYFYLRLERELDTILGLDVARQMVLELEPSAAEVLDTKRLVDTDIFTDIFEHKAFKNTRRYAPAMHVMGVRSIPLDEANVPTLAGSSSARRSFSHLASRRLILPPGQNETLVDALCRAIDTNVDSGVSIVGSRGEEKKISYAELLEKAESKLAGLRSRGLTKGDVCLLILETDLECLSTFWGCILGGIRPALIAPPLAGKGHEDFGRRLIPVWESLQRPMIVVQPSLAKVLPGVISELTLGAIAECVATDSLEGKRTRDIAWSPAHPRDTAFIQFSSGSTGTPKGVCLTHQNVLKDMAGMLEHRGGTCMDVFCSWMPLYHDMGLIGFHLTPILAGANQVLIKPYDFVRRPHLWIEKLSQHRATITSANNFSLERALKGVGRKLSAEVDLSSVRLIITGSEPLSATTISTFMSALSDYGLAKSAMCPAYGLAEATLAVTMWKPTLLPTARYFDRLSLREGQSVVEVEEYAIGAVAMVDLGSVIPEAELRVVDAQHATVREGVVGKILVRGPSVFTGYFGKPAATACAKKNGWLETGDLGFVLDGRLFVSGRVKDVIFVNGQNFYANDLEAALHQIEGLGTNRVAVVGWTDEIDELERVVVFAHPTPGPGRSRDDIRDAIALTINRILGRPVDEIVWVKPRHFLRTTSGKLQRNKMRDAYLANHMGVSSDEPVHYAATA